MSESQRLCIYAYYKYIVYADSTYIVYVYANSTYICTICIC